LPFTPLLFSLHPMSAPIPLPSDAPPSYITTANGDRIAYHQLEGSSPGVIFMGGFRSDMTGSKATRLQEFCQKNGVGFLRFDYHGHGQSEGDFAQGTIGRWADNALAMLDQLAQGKQILIGSSMGGWIMLLVALARPERIAGLVGIASAPDFTEDLIRPAMTAQQRSELQENGHFLAPSEYGTPYPITQRLLEEAREHLLLRSATLPLPCPVRLLHGMQDRDVPWTLSTRLAGKLASDNVQVTYLKDADHRMSDETSLSLLETQLKALLHG